jgi:catechol 2,3-dioxygenase-like lactoylglutathione lyase family enzyme
MSEIARIGNVFYIVEDMDAAVAFYADTLGLPLKFRDGDRWAAFDVGGVTFALAAPEEAGGAAPGSGAVVSFRVADAEAWAREASACGVEPGPVETGPHERRVRLTDLDGNRLVVYSPPAS